MDRRRMAGLRLQAARRIQGHSQRKTSGLLDVSPSKLANWEKGDHYPDPEVLAMFCDLYDIPMDWIYRGGTPGMGAERAADLRRELEQVMRERDADNAAKTA